MSQKQEVWYVILAIVLWQGNISRYVSLYNDIRVDKGEDVKEKILVWARKRLKRFRSKEERSVMVYAAPCFTKKEGKPRELDGDRALKFQIFN